MKLLKPLLLAALLSPFAAPATQPDEDFDSFMRESMNDFNSFITKANREYIDFLRDPWKKYESNEPVQKRVKPEPITVPVFDPKIHKVDDVPQELTVKEILDLTTREGKQGKTVTIDEPQEVIDAKVQPVEPEPAPDEKRKPKTTVIRDTVKAEPKPTPAPAPQNPVKETPKVEPTKPEVKPSKPEVPATPNIPAPAPVTEVKPEPKKEVPAPKPETSPLYSGGEGRMTISFGGVQYHVSNTLKGAITLASVKEKDVASSFEKLYLSDYKPLLADLTTLRKKDLGNDWALYLFIKQVSEKLVGKNESIVLRQFLLNNLGYRARTARNANTNELHLLVAPSVQLYGCIYVDESNAKFYDVESKNPYALYMCPKEAPSAKKTIDMSQAVMPVLKGERKASVHTAKKSSVTVSTSVSKQMADYYNRIPQCDYSVYVNASVDKEVVEPLLSSLRMAIQGKSEREAANILLDFCQNAFEYATDPQQFGYEKPFFVEELFYYPYCDCEDRSILYRYLVKNLLGLDVVLLDYPNHIATAVRFNTEIKGDYVSVGGAKYLVCDPTYIGASIGMAMPQFKSVAANVLRY